MKIPTAGVITLSILALACSAPGEQQQANAQSMERKGPPAGLAIPPPDVGAEDDATPPVDMAGGIAPPFRGEWNTNRRDCGRATEMRLIVDDQLLRFYESVARVISIKPEGDRAITLDTSMSGEGEMRRQAIALALSADGGTLTVTMGDTRTDRVRCA